MEQKSLLPSYSSIIDEVSMKMKMVKLNDCSSFVAKAFIEIDKKPITVRVHKIEDAEVNNYLPHKIWHTHRDDFVLFYYLNSSNPVRPFLNQIPYVFVVYQAPHQTLTYDGRVNVFIDQVRLDCSDPSKGSEYAHVFMIGENNAPYLIDMNSIIKQEEKE